MVCVATMSHKRKREFMERLDSCYSVVQQSCSKGISAREIAQKLGMHRTTAHSYLNTLEFMGKVYSEKGLWYAKEQSGSIKPEEIEIEITLPPFSEPERYWLEKLERDISLSKSEVIRKHLQALLYANIKSRTITIRIRGSQNIEALKDAISEAVKEAYEKHRKKPFWKIA